MIVLILLQQGKGADMGAAFGSGSSGSLFGASGSSNFLSRTTAILAATFFFTSMFLTYLSRETEVSQGVMIENSGSTFEEEQNDGQLSIEEEGGLSEDLSESEVPE